MKEEKNGHQKDAEAVVMEEVDLLTHRRRIFTVRSLPVIDAKRRAGSVYCPKKEAAPLEPPGKRPELQYSQNQLERASLGVLTLGRGAGWAGTVLPKPWRGVSVTR